MKTRLVCIHRELYKPPTVVYLIFMYVCGGVSWGTLFCGIR